MFIIRIQSHNHLQQTADALSEQFKVEDPYTLRGAIVEVLQNTLQHSDGRCAIKFNGDSLTVINRIQEQQMPGYGLGLKMYTGISTRSHKRLFFTVIYPQKVAMDELDIEALLKAV